MKFCPYCGAAIVVGAASFCMECGKGLPPAGIPRTSEGEPRPHPTLERRQPPVGKVPHPGNPRQSNPRPAPNKTAPKGPPRPRTHPANHPDPPRRPRPDPRDEGYDGYYNDVKPIDNGHTRDETDPELVKRIVFIAVGTLVVVIFSVILMYVL